MFTQNVYYQKDIEKLAQAPIDWSAFKDKAILVIGASGMLGTFLIDCLMFQNTENQLNISIYAMGREKQKLAQRFQAYLAHPCFSLHVGDITKPISLDASVDFIIHGASNTHPKAYASDPIGTIMTSIQGTQQVLDFAVQQTQPVRTLFLSTVEIYGENRGDVTYFSEDYCGYIDCNTLRAGYPEGKRASEALCQAYRQKHQLDIMIPRLCRVFGPTMLKSDSKASSQFILNAVNGEDIVLKSEGNQFYSYCYVADVVYALLYLLQHGKSGEAYNVANAAFDLTLKELATKLATLAGTRVVFDLPDQEEAIGFSKATQAVLDTAKIRALGWAPLYTLEEGLEQVIQVLKCEEQS